VILFFVTQWKNGGGGYGACHNLSLHVKINRLLKSTLNQNMIDIGYPPFSLCTLVYLVETPKCAFHSKNKVNVIKSSLWSVISCIIRYAVWCSSIKVGVYCSILIHSLNSTLPCIELVKSIHDSGIQTSQFFKSYRTTKLHMYNHALPKLHRYNHALPSSSMCSGQTCQCEPCRYSCCIRPAEFR
jgi:hypothetical protein